MPTSKVTKTFTFEGKRYYVYGKTEKEAIEKLVLKQIALRDNKTIIEPSSITVREWAYKCLDTYKTNLTDRSRDNFRQIIEYYVIRFIGDMRLKDVRQIHCQEVLNSLSGYSQYVIDQSAQKMKFIFRKAVENDLIAKNPAESLTKPKGYRNSHRALTQQEEAVFIKCAEEHNHGLLFLLMYHCGCRPSEAAEVRVTDFFQRDSRWYLHIRGTKSKAADRVVPAPALVIDKLPPDPFAYAVTTKSGNKLNDRAIRRNWQSLCRAMNIELGCRTHRNKLVTPYPLADDLTPYCLRHTYCTNLQKRKVDIRTAQYLMGHSDISLTANIYTHIDYEALELEYNQITGVV